MMFMENFHFFLLSYFYEQFSNFLYFIFSCEKFYVFSILHVYCAVL